MQIAVSGASGLIGRALCASLAGDGHRVLRLVRRAAAGDDEIAWDPVAGTIDAARLDGLDAIVHLAGANVGEGRWSVARKRELRDSRILSTTLLARTIAERASKPRVFVSASAIGWYGARAAPVDESGRRGEGFLAELCVEWEACADAARAAGMRVVHPRIGIVLSKEGGALAKMLPPFKLGLGVVLGDGAAPLSWVALDDVVAAFAFAIDRRSSVGPVQPDLARADDAARPGRRARPRAPSAGAVPHAWRAVAPRASARWRTRCWTRLRSCRRSSSVTGFRFAYPVAAPCARRTRLGYTPAA